MATRRRRRIYESLCRLLAAAALHCTMLSTARSSPLQHSSARQRFNPRHRTLCGGCTIGLCCNCCCTIRLFAAAKAASARAVSQPAAMIHWRRWWRRCRQSASFVCRSVADGPARCCCCCVRRTTCLGRATRGARQQANNKSGISSGFFLFVHLSGYNSNPSTQ